MVRKSEGLLLVSGLSGTNFLSQVRVVSNVFLQLVSTAQNLFI